MQILLVTMHSIKQQNAHQQEGEKKETDKKQKGRKDQELRRIHNRNSSYKPFALQCDIILFLPTVKCFQEYTVHRKQQQKETNTWVTIEGGTKCSKQAITKMKDFFYKSIKEHLSMHIWIIQFLLQSSFRTGYKTNKQRIKQRQKYWHIPLGLNCLQGRVNHISSSLLCRRCKERSHSTNTDKSKATLRSSKSLNTI